MSLYTPVFPSFDGPDNSRKDSLDNAPAVPPGNYVELLRDVHLFLSTQNDVLSPPSRPSSPLFDHRVQKVRDAIQDVFHATNSKTSSGAWTRVSQTLKLGCVRGRPWSVTKTDPSALDEDINWILPKEESEWFELEKKRDENRRLKARTNAIHPIGSSTAAVSDSQKPNRASIAGPSQPTAMTHVGPHRDVSPATIRAAREKVRKWQVSLSSEDWRDTASGPSSTPIEATGAAGAMEGKTDKPLRSRTLDFAVAKPAAKLLMGKRGKEPLSRLTVRGGSAPALSHKAKSSKPSKGSKLPEDPAPVDADKTDPNQPPNVSPVKIADVPETPYLPPSFPSHLETSTPLPGPAKFIRAKPSPILPLPAPSSTPPPSIPANLPEDRQLVPAEPHAASVSSSLPPQINTTHPGKRSRASSTSLDGVPDDPLLTPPAKKLRTLEQNRSTPVSKHSKPMSPNGGSDIARDTGGDGAIPSHRYSMDTLQMVSSAPFALGEGDSPAMGVDAQGPFEKISSPTKSVKSYFSAPDSDAADSPMKANLLLESPVSPMLTYARNPSGFLPQVTSTQVDKGSPTAGRTNHGGHETGYSSQFDVEKHVDRVSELLEKDVDFDGWLRDVRTVEASEDQH